MLLAVLLLVATGLLACAEQGVDPAGPTSQPGAFDRSAVEQQARDLLGLAEEEVEVGPLTRIVRRGQEDLAATMDRVPGRMDVELDEDGAGGFVVTRVVVEVPDDEDPLVIE